MGVWILNCRISKIWAKCVILSGMVLFMNIKLQLSDIWQISRSRQQKNLAKWIYAWAYLVYALAGGSLPEWVYTFWVCKPVEWCYTKKILNIFKFIYWKINLTTLKVLTYMVASSHHFSNEEHMEGLDKKRYKITSQNIAQCWKAVPGFLM